MSENRFSLDRENQLSSPGLKSGASRGHLGDGKDLSAPSDGALEDILREHLREGGLRVTPDRLTVFRQLTASQKPLTKPELVDRLKSFGINQATVYRVIDLFTALSVVHAVLLPHGLVGYEPIPPFRQHHHHVVCASCASMVALYECEIDQVIRRELNQIDFIPISHSLEVVGLCGKCRNARSPHES